MTAEELISQVTFDPLDVLHLNMLDNARRDANGSTRCSFLVAAIRRSARMRLEVAHQLL